MTDSNTQNTNNNDALSFLPPKDAERASLLIANLQLNMVKGPQQLGTLLELQKILWSQVPHSDEHYKGKMGYQITACLGIIEETIEYLSAIGYKPWRPNPLPRNKQLEEIVDQLFFYLEEIMFSGFTLDEIVDGYTAKWYENMNRYKKAKAGDFSWDNRLEKNEL